MTLLQLGTMTVKALREMAKENGITGVSRATKAELVSTIGFHIIENTEATTAPTPTEETIEKATELAKDMGLLAEELPTTVATEYISENIIPTPQSTITEEAQPSTQGLMEMLEEYDLERAGDEFIYNCTVCNISGDIIGERGYKYSNGTEVVFLSKKRHADLTWARGRMTKGLEKGVTARHKSYIAEMVGFEFIGSVK